VRSEQVLRASYRFCGALARRQARNFYYAFLLLPGARRKSMCALYAFLRRTDDLADEPGSPTEKAEALQSWRVELERALAGQGTLWPGFPALADTVTRHGIPTHLLCDVIEGVSMDIEPRRYATFDDLAVYCHHVASVVGICCLHIWGYRSEGGKAERFAESCGIALQLTNIIRDVRDDVLSGRVYLPEEDMARFGVSADELAEGGRPGDRVRALLTYEAQRAYHFYDDAGRLESLVASSGRPVLRTIVGTYRALLDEIARRDYNVFDGRVSLPNWRKTAIALAGLAGRFTGGDRRRETTAECATANDSIATQR
jgi:phytoene synthase